MAGGSRHRRGGASRWARRAAILVAALLTAGVAGTSVARAQAAETVSLEASPSLVGYGDPVTLSGTIDPPSGGQAVRVVDDAGDPVADATTGAAGRFEVEVSPETNLVVHAEWSGASSEPVAIGVRPRLTVSLGAVRLFNDTIVRGTLAPAHAGRTVTVELRRSGEIVTTGRPTLGSAGGFRTALRVPQPGRYRAVARFADEDHAAARGVTEAGTTPLPSLSEGARGPYVRLLERRLVELAYHLPGVNERFAAPTADAVMAFTKVQGMRRRGSVDVAIWRALADPRRARARSDARGIHVEVDQTRQVLYTVEEGEITNILHVSTGAGGATNDGAFRVSRKLAGYSANGLYYPSYFDGLRAIHGWPEVPPYPASHGCVRVPMWSATWIYGLVPIGTRVLVYHS